jgi:hypothetical protein
VRCKLSLYDGLGKRPLAFDDAAEYKGLNSLGTVVNLVVIKLFQICYMLGKVALGLQLVDIEVHLFGMFSLVLSQYCCKSCCNKVISDLLYAWKSSPGSVTCSH